jgi:hypothetical protein
MTDGTSPPAVQLAAARALLELGLKTSAVEALEARIVDLEGRLAALALRPHQNGAHRHPA